MLSERSQTNDYIYIKLSEMQTKEIETKRALIAWGVGTGVEGQGKEQEGGLTQDTMRLGDGEDFHYFFTGDSFLCLYFCQDLKLYILNMYGSLYVSDTSINLLQKFVPEILDTQYLSSMYCLVVQWLRLHTPNSGGDVLVSRWGSRFPHAN